VGAFAAQAAVVLERQRLARAAAEAAPLAEANKMRTALLAAVGHDLRTPLAAAKPSSQASEQGREWSVEDHDELLETANEALDRLAALVDNLLDMSRLQSGALDVLNRPAALDEVVARALDDIGEDGQHVVVDMPDNLPAVLVDAGLLERVIANLLANAVRYSRPDRPPMLTGSALGEKVELRVIDRGPGIPPEARPGTARSSGWDTDNTTGRLGSPGPRPDRGDDAR
jgi:two-component system sensor histidine kinase KdpD